MEPREGETISSTQIQSALNQLTYLQRILYGADEMTFSDLLASAASESGPSPQLPQGGLSKALPALISPLLTDGASNFEYGSLSQQALLAKRAAFQPRRYLAMTADLMTKTSDTAGDTYKAIRLAQSLNTHSDKDAVKKALQQKILQERKAKKLIIDQQQTQADQSKKMQELSIKQQSVHGSFNMRHSFTFASLLNGQAKQMEPILDAEPDEEVLQSFIQAWQMELMMADGEASGRVYVTLQQTIQSDKHKRFLLRMHISQTGFAWLWLHFNIVSEGIWCARVDRVNVLAESEVEESKGDEFQSIALQSSRFPLYRHITLLLQTRLMQIKIQSTPLWTHLTLALFALAALCRLNELPLQSNFAPPVEGMPMRGQENILDALSHLDISQQEGRDDVATQIATLQNEPIDTTVTNEEVASSPLFSDSHLSP